MKITNYVVRLITPEHEAGKAVADVFPTIVDDGITAVVTIDNNSRLINVRGISSPRNDPADSNEEAIVHAIFDAMVHVCGKNNTIVNGSTPVEALRAFEKLFSVVELD